MIQASTTYKVVTPEMRLGKAYRPRGRASWRAFDLEFEFIYVKKDWFWGFQKIWVNSWYQINITDPERTVLDLIVRPDIFGGITAPVSSWKEQFHKLSVTDGQLCLQYDVGAVIKRLGWLLENGSECESLNSP